MAASPAFRLTAAEYHRLLGTLSQEELDVSAEIAEYLCFGNDLYYRDVGRAIDIWDKRLQEVPKDAKSMVHLGLVLATGWGGIEKREGEGMLLLSRAMEIGNGDLRAARGYWSLAQDPTVFTNPDGKQLARALEIVMEKAEEEKSRLEAQMELADLRSDGWFGVEKNKRVAYELYSKSLRQLSVKGERWLRMCCRAGLIIQNGDEASGLKKDFVAARRYLERACEFVDENEEVNEMRIVVEVYDCLGKMYWVGQGGPVNLWKAMEFYERAYHLCHRLGDNGETSGIEGQMNTTRNEYVIAFALFCLGEYREKDVWGWVVDSQVYCKM